jgi:hypothetical protein
MHALHFAAKLAHPQQTAIAAMHGRPTQTEPFLAFLKTSCKDTGLSSKNGDAPIHTNSR